MKYNAIIVPTLLGTVFCGLIAILILGMGFNNPQHPLFYLLLLGFTGSASLAFIRQNQLRNAIYLNLLILITLGLLTQMHNPPAYLVVWGYFIALFIAVFIYTKIPEKNIIQSILTMVALVSLLFFISSLVHHLFYMELFTWKGVLINAPLGAMIGFGIGLGDAAAFKWIRNA